MFSNKTISRMTNSNYVMPMIQISMHDGSGMICCPAQGQSGMAEASGSCDLKALEIGAAIFEEMGSEDFAAGHSGGFLRAFQKGR